MADGLLRAMIAHKKEPSDVRPRARQRGHTKEFEVTLRIRADPDVSSAGLREYLMDLEWAGGCRHPDDPLFSSVTIVSRRLAQTQRGKYRGS